MYYGNGTRLASVARDDGGRVTGLTWTAAGATTLATDVVERPFSGRVEPQRLDGAPVPIGERAAAWVTKYSADVRPGLVVPPDAGVLFLTREGLDFTPDHLSGLVARYVERAELAKHGSCHLFRHTMATLMLEGGADIRYIQQMLGHAELSTTQIYTQVSIRALKAIHTATHPSATNRPHRHADPNDDPERTDAAEELLDVLDDEAAEEHLADEPVDLPNDLPVPIEDHERHLAGGQPGAPADGPGHAQGPSQRPDGG